VSDVLSSCAGETLLSCVWFAAGAAVEPDVAGFDCAHVVATAKTSAAAINTARVQVIGLTYLSSDKQCARSWSILNVQLRNPTCGGLPIFLEQVTYFSVFTNSAIAFACSSFIPAIALL